jgi:hypothetical protein
MKLERGYLAPRNPFFIGLGVYLALAHPSDHKDGSGDY